MRRAPMAAAAVRGLPNQQQQRAVQRARGRGSQRPVFSTAPSGGRNSSAPLVRGGIKAGTQRGLLVG